MARAMFCPILPPPLCTALHFLRPAAVNSKLSQEKNKVFPYFNTLFMNINCISGFSLKGYIFKLQNEKLLRFIGTERSLCFSQNRTGPDFDFDRLLNSNQIFSAITTEKIYPNIWA